MSCLGSLGQMMALGLGATSQMRYPCIPDGESCEPRVCPPPWCDAPSCCSVDYHCLPDRSDDCYCGPSSTAASSVTMMNASSATVHVPEPTPAPPRPASATIEAAAAEDPENRRKCTGPFHHHEAFHVYNVQSMRAKAGIANKRCGNADGELAYIFGGIKEFSKPEGLIHFYDGVIQMVHVSVSSWGDYLDCSQESGHSTKYSCKCPQGKGKCDMKRAGKKEFYHNKTHYTMYSFPSEGEGKHWSVESGNKTRGCMTIRVTAKCVIDALAEAAGCKNCNVKNQESNCATCIKKLSPSETKQVWDNAIWNGSCPLVKSPTHSNITEGYAIMV